MLDARFVYVYNMDMKWKEALGKLEKCEVDLRRLLGEAAADGDYSTVLRITDLAKAVAALSSEGRGAPSIAMEPPDAPPPTRRPPPSNNASQTKLRPLVETYPRFFRRGDELVKVGWSKTDRKEYNHRAGRRAIDATAAAVRQIGAKGRMFTGDKLLPLKDPTDGSRLADYQAYVALAWFKHLGIVEQHGRKAGYALAADKPIDSTITTAWPELAEWRG